MGLEAATYINDLTSTNPVSTDKRKQGDDHLRLLKTVLKTTFPNADRPFYFDSYEAVTGNLTVDATDMNRVFGVSTASGAVTITLPTNLAATDDGFRVSIVKLETNLNRVTVAPSSGTINGVASLSVLNTGDRIDAVWTGTAWIAVVTYAGRNRITITASTTVDATHMDKVLVVEPASANATITLPAAALYLGRTITIKLNSATYTCSVVPNGAETIDGQTSWALSSRYEMVQLLCVSTGWMVVAALGVETGTVPPGAGMDYWGTSAPSGWLFCFGQAVSRTTYAKLFAAIGTTYGTGDGSTTFNLPDKRGRVSAGKDDMGGSSANRLTNQSGGLNGDTLGATGGAETHTLTVAQLADHGHPFRASYTNQASAASVTTGGFMTSTASASSQAAYDGAVSDAQGQQIGGTGSNEAHNNVQPTIVANYIIKF